MKQLHLFLMLTLAFVSCNKEQNTQTSSNTKPKTPVEVATITYGAIGNELILFGTTYYLKRNAVTSPIAAYITQVNVKLGDKIKRGDVLYVLQSKESKALINSLSKTDTTFKNFGFIKIVAPANGIVTNLDKSQPGDYVTEGTPLCNIVENNDLIIQVNVPFEFTVYTKSGNTATIVLPDNTKHPATFTKALTSMNTTAQTQTILAKCKENLYLPENMIVKVIVEKDRRKDKQLLPKSCVLSDEMMQEFWIMKLVNDSTAVKIPVTVGQKNAESIEVLTPIFEPNVRIVSKGNYGLPDTAFVSIKKTE